MKQVDGAYWRRMSFYFTQIGSYLRNQGVSDALIKHNVKVPDDLEEFMIGFADHLKIKRR